MKQEKQALRLEWAGALCYHGPGMTDTETFTEEQAMASTKEYLDFVLEQLSELEDISFRPMMGEYVIYYQGKVIGGIYDDRFLLKPTKTALRRMGEAGIEPQTELPYEGAKEMLLADVDRRELLCRMVMGIGEDLPAPKKKKLRTGV